MTKILACVRPSPLLKSLGVRPIIFSPTEKEKKEKVRKTHLIAASCKEGVPTEDDHRRRESWLGQGSLERPVGLAHHHHLLIISSDNHHHHHQDYALFVNIVYWSHIAIFAKYRVHHRHQHHLDAGELIARGACDPPSSHDDGLPPLVLEHRACVRPSCLGDFFQFQMRDFCQTEDGACVRLSRLAEVSSN